jgi:hypothetical protein
VGASEFVDQVIAGDRAGDQPAEAFTGVLIDDRGDLDRPSVGGGVELKVDRPYLVRRVRDRGGEEQSPTASELS